MKIFTSYLYKVPHIEDLDLFWTRGEDSGVEDNCRRNNRIEGETGPSLKEKPVLEIYLVFLDTRHLKALKDKIFFLLLTILPPTLM